METNLKFNSAICTSREQSERLLALGLRKETADMVLLKELAYDDKRHCLYDADTYMIRPIDYLNGEEHRSNIPAWSLHRLIEIYDKTCIFWSDCFDNPYEAMISRIAGKIKWGELNKEYLEGK